MADVTVRRSRPSPRTSIARIAARLTASLVVAVASLVLTSGAPASAAVRGDDYPSNLRDAPIGSLIDPWRFYNRNCTSFVAWRMNSANGVPFSNFMTGPNGRTGQFGNANTWDDNAWAIGYPVDGTPTVGAITQTDAGAFGHVAWVVAVGNGTVTIEEYNRSYDGRYGTRNVPASGFQYIHIGVIRESMLWATGNGMWNWSSM